MIAETVAATVLVVYALLSVLAIFVTIGNIGKPRRPVTPQLARAVVVAQGLNLVFYVFLYLLLGSR